ncbi:MAG TPA: hypothetical protein VG273_18085, partial [Bryobacteraceae bacterium]|nr:hypothetical protein [Bryobacteraceae bacterium]
ASLNPAGRGYVNPKLCFVCHAAIYKNNMRTGMGRLFGRPGPENTVEDYAVKNSFYHEASRTYFQMLRRDGKYYQRWYQLDLDGKQTNASELSVDYVLGSAIHARAYIHREAGGRLFQLPVAWYAAKGGYWWMAPGYDSASHPYGRRPITYDCLFCHNSWPTVPANHQKIGDEPVYAGDLPDGIDCQRCHGPGKEHIQRAAAAGARVEDIRAAIVNPKRLPRDREGEVCMQCHSRTTGLRLPHAIKRYHRGDFAYQPGQPLGDFEIQFTFAPGAGQNNWYQNVSTVVRMRKSQCFIRSGGALKCATCHDPHSPDHAGDMAHYNAVCRQCHASAFDKLVAAGKHTGAAGCVDCHMPARRPMDGDKGALHWRRTIKTDIDVFVADVILQGSNGPGLVSSLKRVQPAARVLFISGFELSELSRRGILSSPDLIGGSVEFLQKPFAPEVFMCAVERLIASGGKKT